MNLFLMICCVLPKNFLEIKAHFLGFIRFSSNKLISSFKVHEFLNKLKRLGEFFYFLLIEKRVQMIVPMFFAFLIAFEIIKRDRCSIEFEGNMRPIDLSS